MHSQVVNVTSGNNHT